MPTFTMEDLIKADGKNGNPLYLSLNGAVREYLDDLKPLEQDDQHRYNRLRKNYGPHLEYFFAAMLYDPMYGMPKTINDFTREHAAYMEDWHARFLSSSNPSFKTVGFFD